VEDLAMKFNLKASTTEMASVNPSGTSAAACPAFSRFTPPGKTGRGKSGAASATAACLAAIVCITGIFLFNSQPKAAVKKDHSIPVTVATAQVSAIPLEVRTIGNVTPYSVVNITPQVSGQLIGVYFKQGQPVKKGDLLFQIDPRPYQAALDQANGNVEKDKAQIEAAQANMAKDEANVGQLQANLKKDMSQLVYATAEKQRYTELVDEGAVSHEQADQMTNSWAQAQATIQADHKAIDNGRAVVSADKAQIDTARGTLAADSGVAENARIQLGWTKIYSPIDGRASSLSVYEGNNVTAGANSTPLCTINQVEPIYVTANVPEQYLDDVRRAQQAGSLKMQALLEGAKTDAVDGTIAFLENTVNTSTGTIMLRASFNNGTQHLYPGQFVDVSLVMPPSGKSVVVPSQAVQTTQQGQSIYVVQPDGSVALKPVQIGQTRGDQTAITSGLQAGAQVVTDGQMNLTPGAKVRIMPGSSQRTLAGVQKPTL
jgi:multidrug efflux system membrane fusion protein